MFGLDAISCPMQSFFCNFQLPQRLVLEFPLINIPCKSNALYSCLLNHLGKVKELQEEIRSALPQSDGLLPRPVSHLKTAKKIKLKYKWMVESAASSSSLEAPRKKGKKAPELEIAACRNQGY